MFEGLTIASKNRNPHTSSRCSFWNHASRWIFTIHKKKLAIIHRYIYAMLTAVCNNHIVCVCGYSSMSATFTKNRYTKAKKCHNKNENIWCVMKDIAQLQTITHNKSYHLHTIYHKHVKISYGKLESIISVIAILSVRAHKRPFQWLRKQYFLFWMNWRIWSHLWGNIVLLEWYFCLFIIV